MTGSFISTTSFVNSGRSSWTQLQSEISQANTEVTTSRLADVGLSLGAGTGQGLTIRREDATLQGLTTDDSTLTSSLSQSQSALQSMASDANAFMQSLVQQSDGTMATGAIVEQASANLSSFIN